MRYRYWIFICGVWILVGIFFSSQVYLYTVNTSRAVPFWKALAWQMSAASLFALMTPAILWLARRFRIERHNWPRRLVIHLLAGTLIAAILALGHSCIDIVFSKGFFDQATVNRLPQLIVYLLDKELAVYWLIVGLSHAFSYYNRYRSGELRAAHLEAQLAQAQLQALKMQLHPHFLFNTLNAISELIYKNSEAAEEMLAQLSDMLRLSLDKVGVQEVSLKEEVEFLKKYLEIEQTRFHERLKVEIKVDPQALDACVPNMILQPLVENAVRHAIAPRAAGGLIEIEARRVNGMLRVEVRDDGRGLPVDAQKIFSHSGVGLSNTRARLMHLYGRASHNFILCNSPGRGLTVKLMIPYRENKAKSENDSGDDHRRRTSSA
jgi:signal transduction histidine kinase